MSDLDLNINVNTTPAQRNVKQFEQSVQKLNDSFSSLERTLAKLALGALIAKSIQYADAIQDIGDATGIATEKIMGFSQAVTLSGGSSEQANDGLMKLVAAIGEAAEGSTKAQDAFKAVGVSLKDLRTLSEQDIFEKSIQGLAGIEDTSKRAALQASLFGKSFRGINIQNVAQAYGPAIAQQREYAKSVEAAAQLQDKLDRTFIRLQASILKAIEPLANFVSKLDEQDIQKFIDAMIQLGIAIGALGTGMVILEKLGKVLLFAVGIFASAKVAALDFGKAVGSLGKTAGVSGSYITGFLKAITGNATEMWSKAGGFFGKLGLLIEKLALRFPYLTGGVIALAVAIAKLSQPVLIVAAAIYALNAAVSLSGKSIIGWIEHLTGFEISLDSIAGLFERMARAVGSIPTLPTKLLGGFVGDQLASARQAMRDAAADESEIQRLKNKAEGQAEITKNLAKQAARAKELRDIKDKELRALKQFELGQTQELENMQQGMRFAVARLDFERGLIIQNGELLRLTEDQVEEARMLQQLGEERANEVTKLRQQIEQIKLTTGEDAVAQGKILVLQKQIKEVNAAYLEQQDKLPAALRSLQNAQATAKILEEDRLRTLENITKAYDDQVTRTQTLGDQLKGVGQQISDAMFEGTQIGQSPIEQQIAKIKRDAEQAALAAQRAFAETFGGEDLGPGREAELLAGLDQIKTKFEELAQVQANNARANLEYSRSWAGGWNEAFSEYTNNAMSAATAARDAFQAVTGNMNSAIDNFVSTGKFKFSDFAESIIQDLIKIELKAAASKVLSPILGAVGTGLKSILGFAEGGNPPINRPSIVGEKGPELFVPKTAGTVVPNNALGGQAQVTNNYITNNISAVDAKSVAQLFAENRRTLFGTVKLAEKELSYR